jgi:hypothetical protein
VSWTTTLTAAVRVDADEGLDAVAEAGRRDMGAVAGDGTGGLQTANTFGDGRRGQPDPAAQLAEPDPAVAADVSDLTRTPGEL